MTVDKNSYRSQTEELITLLDMAISRDKAKLEAQQTELASKINLKKSLVHILESLASGDLFSLPENASEPEQTESTFKLNLDGLETGEAILEVLKHLEMRFPDEQIGWGYDEIADILTQNGMLKDSVNPVKAVASAIRYANLSAKERGEAEPIYVVTKGRKNFASLMRKIVITQGVEDLTNTGKGQPVREEQESHWAESDKEKAAA